MVNFSFYTPVSVPIKHVNERALEVARFSFHQILRAVSSLCAKLI